MLNKIMASRKIRWNKLKHAIQMRYNSSSSDEKYINTRVVYKDFLKTKPLAQSPKVQNETIEEILDDFDSWKEWNLKFTTEAKKLTEREDLSYKKMKNMVDLFHREVRKVEKGLHPKSNITYSEKAAQIKANPNLYFTTMESNDDEVMDLKSLRGEGGGGDDEVGKIDLKHFPLSCQGLDKPFTHQRATFIAMLRAGCHYGARSFLSNPMMFQFIYCERQKQHIIDITKSLSALRKVMLLLQQIALANGNIWFVGNSPQARKVVEKMGRKCGEPYLISESFEGIIGNFMEFSTRYREEKLFPLRKLKKGKLIRELNKALPYRIKWGLPDVIVLLNRKGNDCIVNEAVSRSIPVVALCDTDTNPADIMYVIPGNDDIPSSVGFFMEMMGEIIYETKEMMRYNQKLVDESGVLLLEQKSDYGGIEKVNKRICTAKGLSQIEMLNPSLRKRVGKKDAKAAFNDSELEIIAD